MVYFIIGITFFAVGIFPLISILFAKRKKEWMGAALSGCILVGTIFNIMGIGLSNEARNTYNEMVKQKNFIEMNYNSDDIFSQQEAHSLYFQYMFKYNQIIDGGINNVFSKYFGYDIESLKLNLCLEEK